MKKRILAFLLACCMGLGAGACTTPPDSTPGQVVPETKTARILYFENIRNIEYADKVIRQFNRHSKTTAVSVHYYSDGTYDETLRMHLNAGDSSVDCFSVSEAGIANEMAAAGLLVPLSDYTLGTDLDIANYGSAIDAVRQEEELYSLPISKNCWMLFYNKDYFDRMEIPYPQQMTWEEYGDLAKSLTYQEGYHTYWGGFIPPWVMNLGAAAAAEYLTDDELPITTEYAKLLNRFYNVDQSHPNLVTMNRDYGEPYELMINGQLAMMVNADWAISRLYSDAQAKSITLNWDIAPLPVFDFMEAGTTVGNCSYFGISSLSENPDNAFELAAYFCGQEGAMIIAENTFCPAYLVEGSTQAYLDSTRVPGASYVFESTTRNLENTHPLYASLNEAFSNQMSLYLMDLKSLEESFATYYERRALLLSQGKSRENFPEG